MKIRSCCFVAAVAFAAAFGDVGVVKVAKADEAVAPSGAQEAAAALTGPGEDRYARSCAEGILPSVSVKPVLDGIDKATAQAGDVTRVVHGFRSSAQAAVLVPQIAQGLFDTSRTLRRLGDAIKAVKEIQMTQSLLLQGPQTLPPPLSLADGYSTSLLVALFRLVHVHQALFNALIRHRHLICWRRPEIPGSRGERAKCRRPTRSARMVVHALEDLEEALDSALDALVAILAEECKGAGHQAQKKLASSLRETLDSYS